MKEGIVESLLPEILSLDIAAKASVRTIAMLIRALSNSDVIKILNTVSDVHITEACDILARKIARTNDPERLFGDARGHFWTAVTSENLAIAKGNANFISRLFFAPARSHEKIFISSLMACICSVYLGDKKLAIDSYNESRTNFYYYLFSTLDSLNSDDYGKFVERGILYDVITGVEPKGRDKDRFVKAAKQEKEFIDLSNDLFDIYPWQPTLVEGNTRATSAIVGIASGGIPVSGERIEVKKWKVPSEINDIYLI